jgi:hypothetical protein
VLVLVLVLVAKVLVSALYLTSLKVVGLALLLAGMPKLAVL